MKIGILIIILASFSFILTCHNPEKKTIEILNKSITKDSIKIDLTKNQNDSVTIKYGIFFGQCQGICEIEFQIHDYGIEKIEKGWDFNSAPINFPLKNKILRVEKKSYDELISFLNFKIFEKLHDRIGCPDCNDSGLEWIEIGIGEKRKKITIELGASITPINKFLTKLRAIIYEKNNST